jgi:hypothetical protein
MAKKINDLLRFEIAKKWLIFDFETEGLNLFSAKPWQLSYVIFDHKKPEYKFNKFPFWPDLAVSKEAAQKTRFDYERYKSVATDPLEVLNEFESYLYDDDYYISGANLVNFDIYIHNNYRRLLGKKPNFSYIERIFDIQSIQKAIEIGYHKPDSISNACWNFKMANFHQKGIRVSVQALCKKYNIEYDTSQAHDGMWDCMKTFEILSKQLYALNEK